MSHGTNRGPHFSSVNDSPVGAVIAFAGNLGVPNPNNATPQDLSPPSGTNVTNNIEAWGWMLCDGRSLSTHIFPELFAVLGYQYGGSKDQFNIPDYRGYFLRGVDMGTKNDPDVDLRAASPGGSGSNTEVGSIQSDAMLTHQHDYQLASLGAQAGQGSAAISSATTTSTSAIVNEKNQALTPTTGISQYETRPKNIYVNYLVKFTYQPTHIYHSHHSSHF